VTDRMHGRVTRLFVTPIVRSLERILGALPLLVYLDSFRYPLAGEFSMSVDLARINRIPADWGIEVETLAEVYRNCSLKRICQVELCETYEHKHQPLSADNPKTGLMKMSIDIAKAIFRNLAIEGVSLSEGLLNTLVVNYLRTAQDTIKRYNDDAALNGLSFDRHQETMMVEAFTNAIRVAGKEFQENPLYSPLIPNWNRVTSAIPDFLDKLQAVVEEKNSSFP
jgi:glucosyl-3-phosphoglycerate synthase